MKNTKTKWLCGKCAVKYETNTIFGIYHTCDECKEVSICIEIPKDKLILRN